MRKNLIIIYILLSGVIKVYSQGNNDPWILQTSGTTSELRSVCFVDQDIGWVVGSSGAIHKTTDGGSNWKKQNSGTSSKLKSVCFINNSIGYAVGERKGTILKTSNGGSSWQNKHSESFIPEFIEDVYFMNADTGFAVGFLGLDNIYQTTNGGQNWTTTSLDLAWIKDVYFFDNNHGWLVGIVASRIDMHTDPFGGFHVDVYNPHPTIWRTSNGGLDWDKLITFGYEGWFNGVFFSNKDMGWVVGQNGKILKTTNGGNSWISRTSGTSNSLESIFFVNPDIGWIVGGSGTILKSNDGGNTWIKQKSGTTKNLYSVIFVDLYVGYAVGSNGLIIKTKTGGDPTSIKDIFISKIPENFILKQNYPNPFNSSTTIKFSMPYNSFIKLQIFDVLGREIESVATGFYCAGEHQIIWQPNDLTNGTYMYRLQSGDISCLKKLILIK